MTTTVWLTTWQLGDDGVRVGVGDRVDWIACLPAPGSAEQIFGGARSLDLEIDAHRGEGVVVEESGAIVVSDGRTWSVRGVVAAVEAITMTYRRTRLGDEPVEGSGVAEPIGDTDERSWGMCRAHDAAGFVVTLRDEHVEPSEPALERSVWSAEPEVPAHPEDTGPDALLASGASPAGGVWREPVDDVWTPMPDDLDVAEGETVVLFATYEEQGDPASWCRHPSHRS